MFHHLPNLELVARGKFNWILYGVNGTQTNSVPGMTCLSLFHKQRQVLKNSTSGEKSTCMWLSI